MTNIEILKDAFPRNEAAIQGTTTKVIVKTITGPQLRRLASIKDIELKRSGNGIVVLANN